MNILYLHTHDSGRYLEPYGYNVRMPNLLKLAKEGTLFRQAYCAGPTCSASRSALLTGTFPHVNGMMGLAHRGFSINDYRKHLSNYLKTFGYETVLCGMQHEAEDPNRIGYDKVFIRERTEGMNATEWDELNAKSAIEYINKSGDTPFFLSYGLEHTHRVYTEFDESIDKNYVMVPATLPDTDKIREDMTGFITSAMRADQCIGAVLDALEEKGLTEDTIIIYTTDHGIAFPHMKCNLYDSGTGVAFMIKYPGNKSKGMAKDSLVSHIDIFPTICDLLHITKPDWIQGKSLLPIFDNEQDEVNDCVFSEVTFHVTYDPQRAVRTKRYKYIKRFGVHQHYSPANIDNSMSKDFMIENGLLELEVERECLFDLYMDPNERNNVIEQHGYKEIAGMMKEKLSHFMETTNDPLLNGKVPMPKGAVVYKFDCHDPESKDVNDYEQAIY